MLNTEKRNEASMHIDRMDTLSMVSLINKENMNAVMAVDKALPDIAKVCDKVAECFEKGGRLFFRRGSRRHQKYACRKLRNTDWICSW